MLDKEMTILELFRRYPEAQAVFARHGMGCVECMGAMEESIANGARMHGVNLEELLRDLEGLTGRQGPAGVK